jgi:hypothetical protein
MYNRQNAVVLNDFTFWLLETCPCLGWVGGFALFVGA